MVSLPNVVWCFSPPLRFLPHPPDLGPASLAGVPRAGLHDEGVHALGEPSVYFVLLCCFSLCVVSQVSRFAERARACAFCPFLRLRPPYDMVLQTAALHDENYPPRPPSYIEKTPYGPKCWRCLSLEWERCSVSKGIRSR